MIPVDRFCTALTVGAVHRHALGVQHLGQDAHTGTPDTDEMRRAKICGTGRGIERSMGRVKHNGLILGQLTLLEGFPAPLLWLYPVPTQRGMADSDQT